MDDWRPPPSGRSPPRPAGVAPARARGGEPLPAGRPGGGRRPPAGVRWQHRAGGRFRGCASRLETLSPLAVLGRGYAVCWNADRTAVIRDAGRVAEGDRVRVTLARGELDCHVIDRSHD